MRRSSVSDEENLSPARRQYPNIILTMSGINLVLNSALRAATHVNSSKLPKELIKSSASFLSSAPTGGKHTLPDLPYDYDALDCA